MKFPFLKFPSLLSAQLAEAKLEEVLDSLRLRIRSLFTWAKSEVSGFDDLSPLDQKALLRRTVSELVMLGFARGSIAYNSEWLLYSYLLSESKFWPVVMISLQPH